MYILQRIFLNLFFFNALEAANQVAHVSCAQCHTTLMYPYGAPSVKCAICHYVTNVGVIPHTFSYYHPYPLYHHLMLLHCRAIILHLWEHNHFVSFHIFNQMGNTRVPIPVNSLNGATAISPSTSAVSISSFFFTILL